MYHSIYIGTKNTWDDWHLVPTSRPLVNPPEFKSRTVDIPGANGMLDFSTSLTGYPTFSNRTGSWEFLVMNGYDSWEATYSKIMDYVHGRTFMIALEDDPTYYYEGRITVNEWRSEPNWSRIVLNYSVWPFKRRAWNSMAEVVYNPFSITVPANWPQSEFPLHSIIIPYSANSTATRYQTILALDSNNAGTENAKIQKLRVNNASEITVSSMIDLHLVDSVTGKYTSQTFTHSPGTASTWINSTLTFTGNPMTLTGYVKPDMASSIFTGTALKDGLVASMPAATVNTSSAYVQFSSGTAVSVENITAGVTFKANTQYDFVFTIYKASGNKTVNLRVYYTDNTYDVFTPVQTTTISREPVFFRSQAGKTVAGLRKYSSSGTTRIYYNESGIFEILPDVKLDFLYQTGRL